MLSVETYSSMTEAAAHMRATSQYLAGGTLLMRAVNYGDQGFDKILRVAQVDREISQESGRIRIGAGATMRDVMAAHDLDFLHPVARQIGGPAIRNMATVGGNLFAPHPYGDFATALLALDAEVIWVDGRIEPIDSFFSTRGAQRGLVQAVTLARPNRGDFRWSKVSRVKPKGISVMAIAAWLPGGARPTNTRLAFGAMGPTPLRAKAAEAALNNAPLDETGIGAALAVCTQDLQPQDDPLATAWYRREVAPVHLKRLLLNGGR
ncbi:FAD binding domain-containing protein [Roseobacter sp.]|uniref:FAD binding domain-containing protein n=1 Tax=Roseobacter sp. TaxID=1907202 RepID=UPI00385E11A0